MKAFIFAFDTNYNLGAAIVYAESKEIAIDMAKNNQWIWDTNNIHEIDLTNESKVINVTASEFVEFNKIK